MLLIYVPKLTNRLGYTINVVMRDLLKTEFSITTDTETFINHTEERLCYAPQRVETYEGPFLKSCNLLFETSIEEQECHCFEYAGGVAMFPVFGREQALPFDPLAAIFYMLSRYEEYLPHRRDEHGRFLATESLAYKHGFLYKAVVDRWALAIRDVLVKYYPEMHFGHRQGRFVLTVDIDAAYCYRCKGIFRTTMGILRDGLHRKNPREVSRRLRVLRGKEVDPFDTFDYIIGVCERESRCRLLFFPLLGDYGMYDKPASYHNAEFRQLLQHLGDYAKMGVHCSYYCTDEVDKMEEETSRLSEILHRPIVRNRFHFLRFRIPHDYRNLVRNGILHDYSMGFADLPGFRCGTCSVVPFYDLSSDQESELKMHPFVTMDTTFHTHMGVSTDEAKQQFHALIDETRAVGSDFNCIFHNQNLCECFGWEGWRDVFEDTVHYGCAAG